MAFVYYKELGGAYFFNHRDISNAATNIVIRTPTSSMRLLITNLNVSSNLGGTIAFYFGGNNQIKIAQFSIGASLSFAPSITAWESTAIDAPFYAVAASSGTEGWKITAEGFELE